MTDQTITDEQRAAWQRLDEIAAGGASAETERLLLTIEPLLPSELTNPQPALPTEPGRYIGRDDTTWRCASGVIRCLVSPERKAQDYTPFTRLVPERPQITREQVQKCITEWYDHISDGRLIDAILALVNGADQ